VQRRIDGYLLEHFGRTDPRGEDPQRPMGRAEQWLHTFPYGTGFLNLAETLIEYGTSYGDLAADPDAFVQRLLPKPGRPVSRAVLPSLTPGPVYQIYPGLSDDDGVLGWPELDAVYLPAAGRPRRARLEANGPCSPRERHSLLGGPVTHLQLDPKTRMLRRAQAPSDTGMPVNAVATALLSRYEKAASADPVRGHVLLIGTRGDGIEADAPDAAVRHLADLGHSVVQVRIHPDWPAVFGWYGSKARRSQSIAAMAARISHRVYIEPYAGGAAVLFAKPRVPVGIINDLDGQVVIFFRVLRDAEPPNS
jgi:hypothetical protein